MPKNISLDDIDEDAAESGSAETPENLTAPQAPLETVPAAPMPVNATSTPPLETTASVPAAAKSQDEPLPPDLKSGIEALKKAEALPHATKAQKVIRDATLARLRPHVARLQEGLPTVTPTAKELGGYHFKLVSSARRERLELLARNNPEIAELLQERDALAAEVEKLKAHKK